MLIDPMELHPEAWAGGGQHANSGDRRYEARGVGYHGAGTHFESSVCSGLGAGFKEVGAVGGAPVGAVGRLESDGRRGYGSQGDRADASQHYEQVTSGSYGAWAKTAGVTEYGTERWLRILCILTRPWSADASVRLVKLPPFDVVNPTGVSSRLLARDVPKLTWPESPVVLPR